MDMKRLRRILLNTLTLFSLLLFAAVAGMWERSHAKHDLLTLRLSQSCAVSLESCQEFFCLYVPTKLRPDQENFWPSGWFTEPRPRELPQFRSESFLWEPRGGAVWYGGDDTHDGIFGLEIPYYMLLIFSAVLPVTRIVKFCRRRRAVQTRPWRQAISSTLACTSAILLVWAAVSRIECAFPAGTLLMIQGSGGMPAYRLPRQLDFEFRSRLEGLEITAYLPFRKEIHGPPDETSAEYAQWESNIKASNLDRTFGGFHAERRAFYFPRLSGERQATFAGADYRYVIPYWAIMIVSAIAPSIVARRFIRRLRENKRAKAGLCRKCGYDLRATRQRCPECGTMAASISNPVATSPSLQRQE